MFFFRQKKKHEKIDKPLPLRQNGRSANKLNEDYIRRLRRLRPTSFFPGRLFYRSRPTCGKTTFAYCFWRRIRRYQWKKTELFFQHWIASFRNSLSFKRVMPCRFIRCRKMLSFGISTALWTASDSLDKTGREECLMTHTRSKQINISATKIRWFWNWNLLQHFFISPGKGSTKFPMCIFLWQNGRVSTLFCCFHLTRARLSYSWW